MSLNTWSLILFASNMLFYCSMIYAVSSVSNVKKLSFMIVSWILYQTATLWYGIATGQIGFILMFAFQMIATIVTIIISTERNVNENR
jgi:hypothetical protein